MGDRALKTEIEDVFVIKRNRVAFTLNYRGDTAYLAIDPLSEDLPVRAYARLTLAPAKYKHGYLYRAMPFYRIAKPFCPGDIELEKPFPWEKKRGRA